MLWLTLVAWAVPFFFVLGAAWFGVRLGHEFWAGAWRVMRVAAGVWAWLRSLHWWTRFWRSRRPKSLIRFAAFRRFLP